MHPAFSVILLTTLLGVGQGLFLALFSSQAYSVVDVLPAQPGAFYAQGAFIALLFLAGGLVASFFHLGHPERAWRTATMWRTSWLSREVIVLPVVMAAISLYALVNWLGINVDLYGIGMLDQVALSVGVFGVVVTIALFVCTAMIYAAIKFLQEWASPLTLVNYFLLGTASGFSFATAYATLAAPDLTPFYGGWAITLTIAGLLTRVASLYRNARIKQKSTMQTAIGVRHNKVRQGSMGMMGGAYNTREFFHGRTAAFLKSVKWIFLILVFPVPLLLLWAGLAQDNAVLLILAFAVQYTGLLFERWYFFAQANHPQNLYYQIVG